MKYNVLSTITKFRRNMQQDTHPSNSQWLMKVLAPDHFEAPWTSTGQCSDNAHVVVCWITLCHDCTHIKQGEYTVAIYKHTTISLKKR